MHYYPFNIGDYRRQTNHLTLLEHGVYKALLDTYYLTEEPLCSDIAKLMRSHCVRTAEEEKALENVLADFFILTNEGYTHKTCDEVIKEYRTKSEKAKAAANARWSKKNPGKKCQNNADASKVNADASKTDADAMQSDSSSNANGMLTNNQEPITNNQEDKDLSAKADDDPLSNHGDQPVDQAYEIFIYWRDTMSKDPSRTRPTTERMNKIKSRLKKYSIEEIKQAIINCSMTPHNMGQNDRNKQFNDIELICRTDTHLEKFRDSAPVEQRNINTIGKDYSPPEGW